MTYLQAKYIAYLEYCYNVLYIIMIRELLVHNKNGVKILRICGRGFSTQNPNKVSYPIYHNLHLMDILGSSHQS